MPSSVQSESVHQTPGIEAKHGTIMDNGRLVGAQAGVVKYDILTALSVSGLNGSGREQLSMMRLMSLITARYNWRRDELSIGQAEMSRLWGVGDRTAKREVKHWLDTGLLTCVRAGVRGRVAVYRLNVARLAEWSRPHWDLIGADYAARMAGLVPSSAQVVRLETHRPDATRRPVPERWIAVLETLSARFPAQFDAWLAPLGVEETADGLRILARSRFAADYVKTHFGRDISEAVQAVYGSDVDVVIATERGGQGATHVR